MTEHAAACVVCERRTSTSALIVVWVAVKDAADDELRTICTPCANRVYTALLASESRHR